MRQQIIPSSQVPLMLQSWMKPDILNCALLLPRFVLSPDPFIWQLTPSDWQVSQFIHFVESFALSSQSLYHSWTFYKSILLSFGTLHGFRLFFNLVSNTLHLLEDPITMTSEHFHMSTSSVRPAMRGARTSTEVWLSPKHATIWIPKAHGELAQDVRYSSPVNSAPSYTLHPPTSWVSQQRPALFCLLFAIFQTRGVSPHPLSCTSWAVLLAIVWAKLTVKAKWSTSQFINRGNDNNNHTVK